MNIGASRTFTDTPDHDAVSHHMPDAIRDMLATAKRELLITNAYIIPDEKFLARLAELVSRGVKVKVLTNSLATHDVPAVNSHYKQWREPLIRAGSTSTKCAPMRRSAGRSPTAPRFRPASWGCTPRRSWSTGSAPSSAP